MCSDRLSAGFEARLMAGQDVLNSLAPIGFAQLMQEPNKQKQPKGSKTRTPMERTIEPAV